MINHDRFIPIVDPSIWLQTTHFTKEEKWGNYALMDVRLIWNLDRLRLDLNRGMNILKGFATRGHAKKSFHLKGMAVHGSERHPPQEHHGRYGRKQEDQAPVPLHKTASLCC